MTRETTEYLNQQWQCSRRALALLFLAILGGVAGLVCLVELVYYVNRDQYRADHLSVSMYPQRVDSRPVRCCVVEKCRCVDSAPSSTCNRRMHDKAEGSCDQEERCCQRKRCTRKKTCRIGPDGNRKCSSRNSCECVDYGETRCQVRCGWCYRPIVEVSYLPWTQHARYEQCSLAQPARGFPIWPNLTEPRQEDAAPWIWAQAHNDSCWYDMAHNASVSDTCDKLDQASSCRDKLFKGARAGRWMLGFYNRHDQNDIQLGSTLDPYQILPGVIAGLVLFSLFICCVGVCWGGVAANTSRLRQELDKRDAAARRVSQAAAATAAAAKHNTPARLTVV